uniref:Zinc finger CCCH-type containing 12D n=1 Tax=Labrus bergylta TaxID=56723 RepID=A0A3Q3F7R9_9LABR
MSHAKVERFLKLGYSQSDILRVLESLRHDAQTNDILEELIKTCHTRTASNKSAPDSPKLVPQRLQSKSHSAQTCWATALCESHMCTLCARKHKRRSLSFLCLFVVDSGFSLCSHGDKKVFSCQGLQLAVNWFWNKGLRDITVFVPLWRKEQPRPEAPITGKGTFLTAASGVEK